MTITKSAAENIREDFGWFPELLVAAFTNPVIALFVGFVASLFIWKSQTRLSHALDLAAERRKLYRDFLAQIEKTTRRIERSDWSQDPDIRRLWSLQSEIEIVGGSEVVERSASVVVAINDFWMREDQEVISRDGKTRSKFDNVAFESRELMRAMRRELAPPTHSRGSD